MGCYAPTTEVMNMKNDQKYIADDSSKRRTRRWSRLIKPLILLIFALAVWLFGTIAWFAAGRDVSGSGMGVTVKELPFEISVSAPYSATPDYSTVVDSVFGYSATVHETGSGTDAIKWLMNDETLDPNNPMRGLRPGSKGTFSFNIIPKSAGTYTVYFKPVLTGYYAEFNAGSGSHAIDPASIKKDADDNYILQTLSERAAAKNEEYLTLTAAGNTSEAALALKDKNAYLKAETLLNGHILIFEACDGGYYSKLRPINQSFSKTFTFSQAQVDDQTPIPMTIYWIWPNTFAQFLLDNGNSRLHDEAMFSVSQAAIDGVSPRQELINYICAHPDYYFESTNTSVTQSSALPAFIDGAMNSSPDNLIALSNGYNNADQILGENIQILLAEMTVSLTE